MSRLPQKKAAPPDRTAELEHGKILPLVFRLTVPAVIAQLITFLYNIVDRMYVARIDGSGMDALAALGIVLPITLVLQAFANLVGLGGAPRAGICLGEGDREGADGVFHTAFVLLAALGVLLGGVTLAFSRPLVLLFGCPPSAVDYAVDYLRIYACGTLFVMLAQGMNPFILTQGYSLFAMGTVLVGALVNIGLDPLFIFTLDMGVRGSSLATVLSQLCSCLCVLGFFFSRRSLFRLSLRPRALRPRFDRLVSIVSLGFTPFVMTLTECAIQVALGQARSALLLAVTRKVVILIPLCFALTHALGFRGVYLSEGIADLAAGLITSAVIFTTFPKIFRAREAEIRRMRAEQAVK